jgi:putative GTP pyrophosphokinase
MTDEKKQVENPCLEDDKFKSFKGGYIELSNQARAAMNILLARIENLQLGMDAAQERTLIDTVTHRIKTLESCIKKLCRRGYELTPDNLRDYVKDIAGIRVVTPFEDDIFIVADALKNQSGLTVRRVKDYVTNPKENGYASLHLTIEVEVFFLNEKVTVPVEVQIRDKTMDAWAAIEHICEYKCSSEEKSPKALSLFKKLAEYLSSFRKTAIQLRDLNEKKKK